MTQVPLMKRLYALSGRGLPCWLSGSARRCGPEFSTTIGRGT